ncbi:MAG: thiolase family protein [Gemmatimonadota bacterium]|nr:thiolase family protein [Gemmatimonadota bacterium]MDE3173357.1 thiolase family protein [Gemmatimonadota bacterium]MDE3214972.1 thiolase family protein [Gemmatimonadota bacterium]
MTQFEDVWIPYGAYWSSPFCAWQGSFANLAPIPFAAELTRRALGERQLAADDIDGMCLGITVPSKGSFYGAPWLAGLAGLCNLSGPTIHQACATSVRCLVEAAEELEAEGATAYLAVTADRTSNGPHVFYPNPTGPGGTGDSENLVLDSFGHDPYAKNSMLQTAENVAREKGIDRAAQEEITLLRYAQYERARSDEPDFFARYMLQPVEVRQGKRVLGTVTGDEGVHPTTADALGRLRPVLDGGTVTFGTQTHPADGSAGMLLVAGRDRARAMARDGHVDVQLLSYGQARVKQGFMPMATVPAARQALDRAGIGAGQLASVTTHVPFAVNDVLLSRELPMDPEKMNRHGCSLVWGHPQAPTGMRAIEELVEDLVLRGGGYGLFTGCAAGDSAAAAVVRVSTR